MLATAADGCSSYLDQLAADNERLREQLFGSPAFGTPDGNNRSEGLFSSLDHLMIHLANSPADAHNPEPETHVQNPMLGE